MKNSVKTGITALLLCIWTVACSADSDNDISEAAVEAKPAVEEPRHDFSQSPGTAKSLEWSEGMHIAVDGTSLEAFEESLNTIKEQSTETEFTTLNNAIGYMMVYDLGAGRNRTKLAKRLDGQTGAQIIEKSENQRGR